ncbi:MAG: methyltransferase domain-containing protein [Alphaproteobacteria bacterium]|nr:methyltransferase domain-containing protein [Alphaproteobacteria bacterium]
MTNGPPRIFDRHAQALHRARASRRNGDRFLCDVAIDGLMARLVPVNRKFTRGLAVLGDVPAALRNLAPAWHTGLLDDMDRLDVADGGFDLAVSVLWLHSVNDLPGVLAQVKRALNPDGLFAAAMFGGSTLTELRESLAAGEIATLDGITPRVAPFADVRELGTLLQRAGFALPVADVERTTVRYRAFKTLVDDLRLMGETNALAGRQRTLRRDTLRAALERYGTKHSDEQGKLLATFDIAYLIGWSPHESQQQPLRPGSAKMRLADALGTSEHPTGDKARPR